ncbi:hypothetical protein K450DRAFT_261969 [Umbelopsis ramanniana AG]|uniref:Uncharacterized protein n=1 Tax=Umbelopsis ramanniana AG TaxID=1314678 RepID=A0AAD5E2T2_UMBRA|nr:uncharacterized protein K450DRAFT_261969 [Umbelopsis ramanniana AG]KAI8575426.1 hypothetical protein K450DRAFT_261969 [Umbelopsis ramanniana AG]
MSSTQEPVAEPTTAPEAPIETPAAEVAPAEQQAETKEAAKIAKRKSIFNPFGRKKEEAKKEEPTAEAKPEAEVASPEAKPVEEVADKKKSKGLNMLFSRTKSGSPQPKAEESATETTNTELPKIEHLEPIQPETIVNQVGSEEAPKAEETKAPARSTSPFGKRFTNMFKFSKNNDKTEKDQQTKEEQADADATAQEAQEPTQPATAEKPLPEVTATPEETAEQHVVAPQVTASA